MTSVIWEGDLCSRVILGVTKTVNKNLDNPKFVQNWKIEGYYKAYLFNCISYITFMWYLDWQQNIYNFSFLS